jgi:hypothetical protein
MAGGSTQYLTDGFATKIAGSGLLNLYMKTVKPVGLAGGGEVDITTMYNTLWRTRNPKKLITAKPFTASCAYATAMYPELVANLNYNQLFTLTFPDLCTLAVWAWIDDVDPQDVSEGNMPMANVTFIPSNHTNAIPYVETAPAYTVGTTTTSTTPIP